MTTTQQFNTHLTPPDNIPADISSPRAKLIYYYIKTHNGVTKDDITSDLQCKNIEVLDLLSCLTESNHINHTQNGYY